MHLIRVNRTGKIFVCEEGMALEQYKENNKEDETVDLFIYKVVASKKTGELKLEKIT